MLEQKEHYEIPVQPKLSKKDIRVFSNNVYFHYFSWNKLTEEEKMAHAELLVNTLDDIAADVLLFQEVSGGYFDWKGTVRDYDWHGRMDPMLIEKGYKLADVKLDELHPNAIAHGNKPDVNYTPIWYKDELVTFVDGGHKFYDSVALVPDAFISSSKSYTWALFEEKASGKRFIAFTTHFTWCGKPQMSLICRTSDACEINKKIDELAEKYPGVPVMVMGDLNSTRDSQPCMVLKEKLADAKERAAVVINGHLRSCHTIGTFPGVGPAIDHIFASANGLNIKQYQVAVNEGTVTMTDHLPLGIDFTLE